MQDLFDLPNNAHLKQIFYATGSLNTDFQVWEKPKGCTFVSIWLIGPGGAGAAGASNIAGTTRRGGGGGGAAGHSRFFFPASIIPDRLYIRVGKGGIGGVPSSTNPVAGSAVISGTVVHFFRPTTGSGAEGLVANGGNAANNSGAGGGSSSASAESGSIFSKYGLSTYQLGQAGIASNIVNSVSTVNGGNSFVLANQILNPGAAGGGVYLTTAGTGGDISASANVMAAITDGSYQSLAPFFGTGGTGGDAFDNAIGQNGSKGAFGCGGGGGGGGTTGGYGGNGGDGLVIIHCIKL